MATFHHLSKLNINTFEKNPIFCYFCKQKRVTILSIMKTYKLLIALFLFSLFCSCDKEECPCRCGRDNCPENGNSVNSSKNESADYYVKYTASCNYPNILESVAVSTTKGTERFNLHGKRSWEQTYGPVKKGFNANISVNGYNCTIEINVAKNYEPFALKSSGRSTNKSSESISYRIN